MLARLFPYSLLPGKRNSTLSVMIQMSLIQTHQDSCSFDVPLGEHSRRSHSYWCGTLWGSVCIEDMCLGWGKGRGKNHPLGSGSMREPDLTWKEQGLGGVAKLSRSSTDLANARLRGSSPEGTGQLVPPLMTGQGTSWPSALVSPWKLYLWESMHGRVHAFSQI